MCSKLQLFVFFVLCCVTLCVVLAVNEYVTSLRLLAIFSLKQYSAPPCGIEASTSLIHHNPWLVHLEYYKNGTQVNVRCAGSLVGEKHVVTAAHCVNVDMFDSITVRLGEYDLESTIDCVDGVCADEIKRISVANVIVPKGYDGKEFDIAVLVLQHKAPYTDFIRPICLPSAPAGDDVTYTAAGWGEITGSHVYSRIKKIIPLPGWSKQKCLSVYGDKLPTRTICAGGIENIDTCRGDSGGPLTMYRNRVELYGVTSLGNVHCGTEGSPGIYTSVYEYRDYIENIIESTSD